MDHSEYQRYLAGREWALLKEQVKARDFNQCERCKVGSHEVTHHLTYERIGHESPEDLLGLCRECHKFLSGKSDHDPAAYRLVLLQEVMVRIKKAQSIVDQAFGLMNEECFPDGEFDHCDYDLSQDFSHLIGGLQIEIDTCSISKSGTSNSSNITNKETHRG